MSISKKRDREMISWLSHQVRTPLSVLHNLASLALEGGYQESQRIEMMKIIRDEAGRMKILVGDLIDLQRIEAGIEDFDPTWLAMSSVMEEAVRRAGVSRDTVTVTEAGDERVWGVRERLTQMVEAVLRHSAALRAPGSMIDLEVETTHEATVVLIRDEGPQVGSDPEEILCLGGTSGQRPGDLDLAVARAIADVHQGRVEVVNRSPAGVEFRITLPRGPAGP